MHKPTLEKDVIVEIYYRGMHDLSPGF